MKKKAKKLIRKFNKLPEKYKIPLFVVFEGLITLAIVDLQSYASTVDNKYKIIIIAGVVAYMTMLANALAKKLSTKTDNTNPA